MQCALAFFFPERHSLRSGTWGIGHAERFCSRSSIRFDRHFAIVPLRRGMARNRVLARANCRGVAAGAVVGRPDGGRGIAADLGISHEVLAAILDGVCARLGVAGFERLAVLVCGMHDFWREQLPCPLRQRELSDEETMSAVATGHRGAFDQLFNRSQAWMERTAARLAASRTWPRTLPKRSFTNYRRPGETACRFENFRLRLHADPPQVQVRLAH